MSTTEPMPRSLNAPELVYNHHSFGKMMNHLRGQTLLALDTESDSLYRYYPRVCLIQITTFATDPTGAEDVVDYLLDPLRFADLSTLAALVADPDVEVILHAAENDVLQLQREFDFSFGRIFDTQLACRILGWKQVGLAAILENEFGIVSDKRMQRTNWGKRPLTPQQIAYAQTDTHFLPVLRKRLIEELKAADRWEEAQEAFSMLASIDYSDYEPPVRSFWQMKSTRKVPRRDTGVLESVWLWREEEAQRQNRPPFKIMGETVLVALATRRPTTVEQLTAIHGLSKISCKDMAPNYCGLSKKRVADRCLRCPRQSCGQSRHWPARC
ncbi:MAG: ribonuclease D [Caldilineaceae bacterium]|nr:ribonuclease D [Caldilineaceae bacterium]